MTPKDSEIKKIETQKCFSTPTNIHTKWLEVRKKILESNRSPLVSAKVHQSLSELSDFSNCCFIYWRISNLESVGLAEIGMGLIKKFGVPKKDQLVQKFSLG